MFSCRFAIVSYCQTASFFFCGIHNISSSYRFNFHNLKFYVNISINIETDS